MAENIYGLSDPCEPSPVVTTESDKRGSPDETDNSTDGLLIVVIIIYMLDIIIAMEIYS